MMEALRRAALRPGAEAVGAPLPHVMAAAAKPAASGAHSIRRARALEGPAESAGVIRL